MARSNKLTTPHCHGVQVSHYVIQANAGGASTKASPEWDLSRIASQATFSYNALENEKNRYDECYVPPDLVSRVEKNTCQIPDC
jgi:hypothetical protein